jgi:N utilization substance protein B
MNRNDRFERRKRSRRRALQAIYQWQITGQPAAEILVQFQNAQDLSEVDEEHFESLLRGVTADESDLNEALQSFLVRPKVEVDLLGRVVLLIGAWELRNCPETPFRVVLDESVDLARRFGSEQGHSYVNAVLDKAAKEWRGVETGASGKT